MNLIEHAPLILLGILAFVTLLAVIKADAQDKILVIFLMLFMHLPLLAGVLLLWLCPYFDESVNFYRAIVWITLGSIFAFFQTYLWLKYDRYESGGEFMVHILIMGVAFVLLAIAELVIYLVSV